MSDLCFIVLLCNGTVKIFLLIISSALSPQHPHTPVNLFKKLTIELLSLPPAFSVHHPGFARWAQNPARSQPALPVWLLRVQSPWKPGHLPSGNDGGELPASPRRVWATGQGALPPEEDCGRNGAEDRHTETHTNCQVKINFKFTWFRGPLAATLGCHHV